MIQAQERFIFFPPKQRETRGTRRVKVKHTTGRFHLWLLYIQVHRVSRMNQSLKHFHRGAAYIYLRRGSYASGDNSMHAHILQA